MAVFLEAGERCAEHRCTSIGGLPGDTSDWDCVFATGLPSYDPKVVRTAELKLQRDFPLTALRASMSMSRFHPWLVNLDGRFSLVMRTYLQSFRSNWRSLFRAPMLPLSVRAAAVNMTLSANLRRGELTTLAILIVERRALDDGRPNRGGQEKKTKVQVSVRSPAR
jgi:hypothetical protein